MGYIYTRRRAPLSALNQVNDILQRTVWSSIYPSFFFLFFFFFISLDHICRSRSCAISVFHHSDNSSFTEEKKNTSISKYSTQHKHKYGIVSAREMNKGIRKNEKKKIKRET